MSICLLPWSLRLSGNNNRWGRLYQNQMGDTVHTSETTVPGLWEVTTGRQQPGKGPSSLHWGATWCFGPPCLQLPLTEDTTAQPHLKVSSVAKGCSKVLPLTLQRCQRLYLQSRCLSVQRRSGQAAACCQESTRGRGWDHCGLKSTYFGFQPKAGTV